MFLVFIYVYCSLARFCMVYLSQLGGESFPFFPFGLWVFHMFVFFLSKRSLAVAVLSVVILSQAAFASNLIVH